MVYDVAQEGLPPGRLPKYYRPDPPNLSMDHLSGPELPNVKFGESDYIQPTDVCLFFLSLDRATASGANHDATF